MRADKAAPRGKRSCCRCPAWPVPWSRWRGMNRSAASSSRSLPTAGRPVREMSHGRGAQAV